MLDPAILADGRWTVTGEHATVSAMSTLLSIGDFSRMTYLSVKTLRHYHEVGVLEPARVDPDTGYRYYRPDQVTAAQIVRRFRDLGMPLDEVRAVVHAGDPGTRDRTITAHLDRMERRLDETRTAVASLRALLTESRAAPDVRYRHEPVTASLAITAEVAGEDVVAWWLAAFQEVHRTAVLTGSTRTGPDGALFSGGFFEDGGGEITAFVPVTPGTAPGGRVRAFDVPAAHLAVLRHRGPFGDLDRTYGALGTWVAERGAGADGPIRERYLPLGRGDDLFHHETEVGWPLAGPVR